MTAPDCKDTFQSLESPAFSIQPTARNTRQIITVSIVLVLGCGAISLAWLRTASAYPNIANENHVMEWTQVAALALAALIGMSRAFRLHSQFDRVIAMLTPTLAISVLLRELELTTLSVPNAVKFIDTASGYLTLAAWIPIITIFILRHQQLLPRLVLFARSWPGLFNSIAVVMYLLGWPSDRLHWSLHGVSPMFLEELLETHASLFHMLAGCAIETRPAKYLNGESR
jgi:hypothetical protein